MQRSLMRAGGLLRSSARANNTVRRNLNAGDRQIGDYPNLPWESAQKRDPFKYTDKQDRRNYNQTVRASLAAVV